MSGRRSPVDTGAEELPEGIYVNPDNLPVSDPAQVVDQDRSFMSDRPDVAPTRGSSTKTGFKKVGTFFKKGTEKLKIKKKDKDVHSGGAAQLGDVMGKIGGSSVTSSAAGASTASTSSERPKIDLSQPYSPTMSKPPQFTSFEQSYPVVSKEPHDTSTMNETKLESVRTGFRNFFHGPLAPSPPMSPNADMDKAPLNPPPPKSPCRISVVLLVIFGLIIIIGIILLIAGAGDNGKVTEHCKILGPCFLGLGLFGLVGDIFFMLFWKEDPIPILNEPMEKVNEKIGAVSDPYGLKDPQSSQRQSYYPGLLKQYVEMGGVPTSPVAFGAMPASPVAKESIPMYPVGPGRYDDLPLPPPHMEGPTGPAALGFEGQDSGAPGGPAAYYDDPPSTDTSIDMRTRPGYSPPGVHNSSYEPDSYRQQPARMM